MGDKGGGVIRKNDPNSDFWQHVERVSRKVDGFPPWKLGRLEQKDSRELSRLRVEVSSLAFALRGLWAAVDDMMHVDTAGKGLPQKARLARAMRLAREALERLSQ